MGKVNKNSNLYDKDGKFLHKPGKYTMEEIEALVDTLDKNSIEFTNATAILMHMYEQKGNPHKDELIQKLIEQSKTKTTKAEVVNALKDIKNETEDGENGSNAKGCVSDTVKGTGKRRRRSRLNEANTTISTAA